MERNIDITYSVRVSGSHKDKGSARVNIPKKLRELYDIRVGDLIQVKLVKVVRVGDNNDTKDNQEYNS